MDNSLRLQTYATVSNIELRPTTLAYLKTMLTHSHLQNWIAAALRETRRIDKDEAGRIVKVRGVLA